MIQFIRCHRLRRVALWIGGWACAGALAGCYPSLPKDLASLEPLDACQPLNNAELLGKARHFYHQTDLFTLRCALGQLRGRTLSDIHKTSIPAKICFLIASRFANDPKQQERLAAEGVRWAEIAQPDGGPQGGEIQYYYAVNLGMVIRQHITLAATRLSSLVKALESASKLAPQVDWGGPWRVLGALYLMAPAWPQGMGDTEKALELLKKAVDQYPEHPQNHFYYAKALWETDQDAGRGEAQKQLHQTELMLAQKDFSEVADLWRKELKQFADEIKVPISEPLSQPAAPSARRKR